MGLRFKGQKGPRCAPHPSSQRVGGPHLGAQWGSRARVGRANALHSSPAPPGGPLPPDSPVLPSASFLCPQDQCGRGEEGALEGRGPAWALSRLPGPEWAGQMPSAPLLLLQDGSSHLPLLISPASGVPILSGLHFSSPLSPPRPTSSLGGSSCLLGRQGPPPAAGRHPNFGEVLTRHLPTLPS